MRMIYNDEYFAISTLSPLNIKFNIRADSLNFFRNGIVTKNRPNSYYSSTLATRSSSFADRFRGIHVTSDQPINVLFRSHTLEYLILPYHEYPGVSQYEYYAVSTSSYRNTSLSQVLLVGCINNTVINIIPTVDLFIPIDVQKSGSDDILVTKGNSHTITLHEGQTLLLGKGNGSDISGTHFISNKPLTVITGHQCGSTPDMIEHFHCNEMQLQILPTITWGKKFILTNFRNTVDKSLYSSIVKTVTSQANTSITIYCNGTTNTTRYSTNGAIGTYQYNITEYCYMEADKPIFVVLFPHSYFYYYTTMVLIPPIEQYLQEVNFYWVPLYYYYSKLVITASVEGFSPTAILHNGLATVNWTAVYDSSRNIVAYGTEIKINPSTNHSVIHTDRIGKLSVQIQGYDYIADIYGRPAVVLLEPNVIPVCNFSCGNGNCVADNLCQCFDGWTGDQCDEVLCSPVCGNGYCVPTNSCVCNPGWTGDRCRIDIDECSLDVCNQICINTQGSYTCECNLGYQFINNNSTCEDINECETVDHNCTQTCSNTVGSYTCSCRAGYKDNGYGNCTDIDECSMGTSGCQQLCFNTNGSYYCQCNTGYKLMNDNSSCDDINECIEDPGVCPLRSNCINTLGSYQCNCIDGYQMNNTGMCIDIDECVTGTHS
uniref:EGF-like domain-containing protein n=1 Tax=Amphimedon queenslandica TaxID=400682 RepID=A0A1X7T7F8_AMPQE